MKRWGFSIIGLGLVLAAGTSSAAEKGTRFWNLTSKTVNTLQLAPAGTTTFGANQALNDKDKEVDHDERLKVTEVETGTYDAKVGFPDGKACLVKGIKVEVGKVFSIEDKDLTDCK